MALAVAMVAFVDVAFAIAVVAFVGELITVVAGAVAVAGGDVSDGVALAVGVTIAVVAVLEDAVTPVVAGGAAAMV